MNEERYVSAAEFAREAGLTLQYVYSLLAAGRLSAEKRDGRWAIQIVELDRRREAVSA